MQLILDLKTSLAVHSMQTAVLFNELSYASHSILLSCHLTYATIGFYSTEA